MNVLSLCAGIGGLDLGLRLAAPDARTVCYVELDPFCQEILLRRQDDGWLDRAPIWPDLSTFDGRPWRGLVDGVIGGWPCQPFSVAGKRGGVTDPRHLWPHFARILDECRPRWLFGENVPGLLTTRTPDGREAFRVVEDDLSRLGYRAAAVLVTAAEVGAPHRRQRLFILATTESDGLEGRSKISESRRRTIAGRGEGLGHADESGSQGRGESVGGSSDQCAFGAASAEMADTGHAERSGREGEEERQGQGHGARGEPAPRDRTVWLDAGGLPAWPPGPTEQDRWAGILARWPDLAPAVADTGSRNAQRGQSERSELCPEASGQGAEAVAGDGYAAVADAPGRRPRDARRGQGARGPAEGAAHQPPLRGVAPRLPSRVERLRALGNAVVPQCAALAYRLLREELGR